MLEIKHDQLIFSFPEIHESAKLTVSFQRTLRIPDDGENYPLPPGLGNFPLRHVDDFKDRVPDAWKKHGGVMMPMYQSEAMWIKFTASYHLSSLTPYPFAIKVATGKRNAITGKRWTVDLREGNYLVVPSQPWLDGYVIEKGRIRQFVAAPLGLGVTAEEQLTGKAEFGGLQIEVIPMKSSEFCKRLPIRQIHFNQNQYFPYAPYPYVPWVPFNPYVPYTPINPYKFGDTQPWLETITFCSESTAVPNNNLLRSSSPKQTVPEIFDMGLAPGGTMKQQIFEDPYCLSDWESKGSRCFVHLLNSASWKAVTNTLPPTTPWTASDYARHNMPWYDYYSDTKKAVSSTKKMKKLKGVSELMPSLLPDNASVRISKSKVRDGIWG